MFTKSNKINLTTENVIGNTPVVSETPLCLDIAKDIMLVEVKQDGDFE